MRYEMPLSYPDQIKVVEQIGKLQGLLDAVCDCLVYSPDTDDGRFADRCLTLAMNLAKKIMEETEVSDDGQTEQ